MFFGEISQWLKKRSVDKEIAQLNAQAEELEKKNKEISDSLSFLNTQDYQEKIAREQLNLKKEGELVFDTSADQNYFISQTNNNKEEKNEDSNLIKWYNYFFKK